MQNGLGVNARPPEVVQQDAAELMDVTDMACRKPAVRKTRGALCTGWEIEVGKVHCGEFEFGGGSTIYIKKTVLFDKDQGELLGE